MPALTCELLTFMRPCLGPHNDACAVAGIDDLTIHGLRRSFKSLTEWLEIPAGVVVQLMGHKPSATAEKHYTVRPLDLLRRHHEKIEAWILERAGIVFDAHAARGGPEVPFKIPLWIFAFTPTQSAEPRSRTG